MAFRYPKIYKDRSIAYEEANDRLIFSFSLPNVVGVGVDAPMADYNDNMNRG